MSKRQLDAMNYNGVNSLLDFGILLQTKSIGEAIPNEIRESVPYMDGDYDFTGKFAPVSYQNRKITVSFKMFANSENELFELRTRLVEWLSARDTEMYFDNMPDYIFTGCSCIIKSFKPYNKNTRYGTITLEITADPYILLRGKRGDVTLAEFTNGLTYMYYYPTGYLITNLATQQIPFSDNQGAYIKTTQKLPNTPCVLDLYGNSHQEAIYYSDNGETELTRIGELTINDVFHGYYRFDPAIDGDEYLDTAQVRGRGSSGGSGLSAVMCVAETLSAFDAEREIYLVDKNGELDTISPDTASFIANFGYGTVKLIQKYSKKVL